MWGHVKDFRIIYLSKEEKLEWMKNVKPIVEYNSTSYKF